jgi:1-acyl-sn-glycerol-3-phosphate acyltransferase
MIAILRSLLHFSGMALSTVFIAPLVLLSFPLPFQYRYGISKLWTKFNIWWLRQTCGINYKIIGSENLPKHAVVILAKHQSTWETIFLHQYLPPLTWVIKKELVSIPLFGWSLASLQPIAINRRSVKIAIKQILEQGKHYLDAGRWVLIFPEGTRTAPGERKRYHTGGARLAAKSGYPVLPIAHNAGKYWPKHGLRKQPGTVTIVFGPLIETKGRTPQEVNDLAEHWIENTMLTINDR